MHEDNGQRFEALFGAVRRACAPATWSRGVELTRARAVVGVETGDEEVRFRVSTRGGMISPNVRLFPDDAEWECSCPSLDDACEHVAAAVIAWRRSREAGRELQSTRDAGEVEYRFHRRPGGLALERFIARGGEARRLEATLAAIATGQIDGPRFVASQDDLGVELALGTHRGGLLSRAQVASVFRALRRCSAIRLDGRPVRVSLDPVVPIARLTDQNDGFRLVVEEDPSVSETFDNGIVRCGDVLRPLGQTRLTGREIHELTAGRHFSQDEVGELVTQLLPSLEKRVVVRVETERLPDTALVPPRIRLELERSGDVLSVLPTLVYGDPATARVDGGRLVHLAGAVPVRDLAAERRLNRRLQDELRLAVGVRESFSGELAVAFARKLDRWKASLAGRGREYFRLAPPLQPRVRLEGARLDVSFESVGAGPSGGGRHGAADPQAVLGAWRQGASLVPLLGGGWAPLPTDWLERYGHRIAHLLEASAADGSVPRGCIPDLARLGEELNLTVPPDFTRLRRTLERIDGIEETELPADLTATLRPYQRSGVDWLRFMRRAGLGALLADDMGLGKTLQVLCAVSGRTLVVAPTSVLHNWVDEMRRHRPGLSHAVYHGPGRKLASEADVTLTTYAILRLDADRLAAERWDTVVLDEAQAIKNPESQVAAAAFRLQADCRITLTGTPVENRLDELWSQFHFINRGLLGGRDTFQRSYAGPIADGEPGVAKRLRQRVGPFVLRRLKQDVATDLPPRTESVLRCELGPAEREAYDAVRAATLSEVVAKLRAGGGVMAALEALLRLRQAACHAALIPGHEASGSAKIDLLLEMLDSVVAEGHKALVFSQWTSLLDLTEPHLERAAISYTRLDGSTKDRAGVVGTFQSADGPPVMLVSLRAGGTGLNLTAADHVFLMDPWWNPAVEQQAADRAHRIGQERPVMVYRLVAEETVEERILELQQSKRMLAEAALGGADQAAGLRREDLLDLLGAT